MNPSSDDTGGLARLTPLLRELCDLKRVRSAQSCGHSLAGLGFVRAWARLLGGEDCTVVALDETARHVASARLGGIDAAVLADAGLNGEERARVAKASFAAVSRAVPEAVRGRLEAALLQGFHERTRAREPVPDVDSLPSFVGLLAEQPRAGATRPGMPRLVLEPPEDHAEHCYTVAVNAVLLAGLHGGEDDLATPFLMGLAHHFHNAWMPDGGFTGEEMLGELLQPAMDAFNARAMAELPGGLRDRVERARALLPSQDTPAGRAFNAGDVLDRVIQMEHYARAARFELGQALEDLDLVHPGPLQRFHQEVLARAGVWPPR